MKKNLLVITGAGASYDSQGKESILNESDRPPLAKDIFSCPGLGARLRNDRYELIKSVSALYSVQYKQFEASSQLEPFLSRLQQRAKTDSVSKRQFHQIHFYLRDLLSGAAGFTGNSPNAYVPLVSLIYNEFTWLGRVLFLTVNYDLILDTVLEWHFDHRFKSMNSYLDFGPKWALVKFHGSVNWIRYLSAGCFNRLQPLPVEALANKKDFELQLEKEIRVSPDKPTPKTPAYPWLAAPLGKYEPYCPDEHLNFLKDFLAEGPFDTLAIGFSALDQDLMSLINNYSKNCKTLYTVSGTDSENAALIAGRFRSQSHSNVNCGFSDFAKGFVPGWIQTLQR